MGKQLAFSICFLLLNANLSMMVFAQQEDSAVPDCPLPPTEPPPPPNFAAPPQRERKFECPGVGGQQNPTSNPFGWDTLRRYPKKNKS